MDLNKKNKTEKQSSGMKKRTALLAGLGIAAAVLVIGGVGIAKGCSKAKENALRGTKVSVQQVDMPKLLSGKQSDDNVINEMRDELNSISSYLSQLDKEIVNNRTSLEKVMDADGEEKGRTDTNTITIDMFCEQLKQELSSVSVGYENLYVKFESYEKQFAEYLKNYVMTTEATHTGIVSLQQDVSEVKESLYEVRNSIINMLEELEEKENQTRVQLNEQIQAVKNYISETNSLILNTEKNVQDALENAEAQSGEKYAQLIDLFMQMESDLELMIESDMTALDETINAMNDAVTLQISESAAEMKEQMQGVIKAESSVIQESLDSSVTVLKNQMTDIHGQISVTQGEIEALLQSMDEEQDIRYEEIMDGIKNAVEDIDDSVDSAYTNLQALIRLFNADMAENHSDTLDTLEEMEESMAQSMTDNLSRINDSFGNLNITLDTYFQEMQKSQNAAQDALDTVVEELGTDLTENQQVILDKLQEHDNKNTAEQEYIKQAIEQHNSDMHLESAEIKDKIEEHNTGILSALESFVNSVGQKLDAVFTLVSNGKKLLASALLTKSVSVNEDAAFEEFADAILAIPQEIVIGVQQIPGEISYDYHYHTDANGTQLHEDINSSAGGCYTVSVYHQHSSACYSKTSCGGSVSYKTASTHWKCSSDLNCLKHGCYWEEPNDLYPSGCWHCYCPDESYTECNSCGAINAGSPCGALTTTLTCGKNGSTVEGYKVGCGLSDGQITGAHIVYSSDVSSAAAVSMMKLESPNEEEMLPDGIIQDKTAGYPEIDLPDGAAVDRGTAKNPVQEEATEAVMEETDEITQAAETEEEIETAEAEEAEETETAESEEEMSE